MLLLDLIYVLLYLTGQHILGYRRNALPLASWIMIMDMYTSTEIHIYMHIHIYIDTDIHRCTQTHIYTYTDTCTHTWTHTYSHTRMRTDAHIHTHMHPYTPTDICDDALLCATCARCV